MHRILRHSFLFPIFLALVLFTLTGCSGFKYAVYDMAIGMERRGSGLEPSTLTVDGFEIAILEGKGKGERPTLVLVHGFGASKEVWLRFSRQLKDEFHIIAVDLPGHGDSSKKTDIDYGIQNQMSYLRAILAELNIDVPHLAGNSMGGTIIALYAARYPEEITSITLFNPAGISLHESELMRLLEQGKNPLIVKNQDDFNKMLAFSMEKKPFLIWPITSVMAEKAMLNGPLNNKIFNDILQDAKKDFTEVLSTIRIPALIVWGRHDRVINAENGRVFDELIPNSRLVILEDVGHVPMIESPQASAALVREFVKSVNSQ